MIYESDKIRKQKETMEYQLEKIGVNIDRIKKATEELKEDRGYVRTGDREKYDEEQDRKRKADETLREQEEKKQKTITVGEGEEVILIEEDHEQKLARQQQEIIRQQEILLQNQEQHILNQETRIRRMEEQKLQPQQPFSQTMSTSSRFKKPIATGGAGTIDKFLSAKGMRFMPKCLVKQEPTEEEEDEDVMITEVTKKTETVKYLPKAVPGIENLVLVQVPKSKTTAKRSSKAGPVPEDLQDPKRFYCDKCEAHYKRPDELTRHKKKNCLKEDPEYFCEECGKGFFYENTVREHYYHIHTDIMLWHCTRCGEGFHFKSNKSKHRNACPNKNGPEIYQPRAPFDEKLEETFKPKTAIPVSIPPQAQPDPQPKPEDKPKDQPEDQPEDQPRTRRTICGRR